MKSDSWAARSQDQWAARGPLLPRQTAVAGRGSGPPQSLDKQLLALIPQPFTPALPPGHSPVSHHHLHRPLLQKPAAIPRVAGSVAMATIPLVTSAINWRRNPLKSVNVIKPDTRHEGPVYRIALDKNEEQQRCGSLWKMTSGKSGYTCLSRDIPSRCVPCNLFWPMYNNVILIYIK